MQNSRAIYRVVDAVAVGSTDVGVGSVDVIDIVGIVDDAVVCP